MSTPRATSAYARAAAAGIFVAVLALAGCTGTHTAAPNSGSQAGAPSDPSKPVTITFWHGWSLPSDLAALNANLAKFEKLHPNITVKSTPNVADDKILQGLRGANGPDVVSSFTADNVGEFCKGALVDLNPRLQTAGIDRGTFVKARINYTQYRGKQCTLPLLGDAFGLYYNTDMFHAAGITDPPKTWTEFTSDAVKLTHINGATYSQLGVMPTFHGYESQPSVWMNQWRPRYLDSNGKSSLSRDPQVSKFFTYTQSLVNALGGFGRLEKYRATFGDEFSAQNAFEAGKVAMQMDGEWRIANIREDKTSIHWAAAPLPVPDDQLNTYGKGYLTGTVIGISHASRQQDAAWLLVKYLTTDTGALVSFANAINNVPSTVASLSSSGLTKDPNFGVFLRIAANRYSQGTPSSSNGGEYQTILNRFAYDWEAGHVGNLAAGLATVDKRIDAANAQSGN